MFFSTAISCLAYVMVLCSAANIFVSVLSGLARKDQEHRFGTFLLSGKYYKTEKGDSGLELGFHFEILSFIHKNHFPSIIKKPDTNGANIHIANFISSTNREHNYFITMGTN